MTRLAVLNRHLLSVDNASILCHQRPNGLEHFDLTGQIDSFTSSKAMSTLWSFRDNSFIDLLQTLAKSKRMKKKMVWNKTKKDAITEVFNQKKYYINNCPSLYHGILPYSIGYHRENAAVLIQSMKSGNRNNSPFLSLFPVLFSQFHGYVPNSIYISDQSRILSKLFS